MKRLQKVLSRGSYNPLPLLKVLRPSCQLDGEVPPSLDVNGPRTSKSGQALTQSSRYPSSHYLLLIDEGEPENFKETQAHMEKKKWLQVMQEEISYLQKNKTYELVKLPKENRALRNKWVLKLKRDGRRKLAK